MVKNSNETEALAIEEAAQMDRHFNDFHVAGFTYYDGVDVFAELKIGTELAFAAEPQNKYDNCAVAIYYKNYKLGYIPHGKNKYISKFLNFGHSGLFEVKINRISPEEHPEQQISVVVKIKDITQKPKRKAAG
ncbi:MAG: HIRAN domain-containing protein [Spirochaetaceae bacterium]|jgi:hypothetical protein|nr:HIRAN domain-containing protein [Spirochaetaceae bacterium]